MIIVDEKEQTAINILNAAKQGETSLEELRNIVAELSGTQFSKKADILLVQVLAGIIRHYEEWGVDETDEWQWHWSGVATGKYPLEKLPDHVRDLAKTLYYN